MVLKQKKGLVILCVLLSFAFSMYAQDETIVKEYISRYKLLAMLEQQRSGIPAAITLAQGIHETQAGTSELATVANNHFGIKCKKEWTGETFAHTDDAPNECFRKYSKAEDSYKDHSDYLVNSLRYASLFKLSITDYMAWAFGLKQCGYATNPRYAQTLIKYIEDYGLQDYTYAAMGKANPESYAAKNAEIIPEHDAAPASPPVVQETPMIKDTLLIKDTLPDAPKVAEEIAKPVAPVTPETAVKDEVPPYGVIVKVNGLKAVYVKKGETPLEYAYKLDIRYARLLEMNEIGEWPFPADMYLYLERKNFKGVRPTHTVRPGETISMISQTEGMQIKYLRIFNLMAVNEEPVPGTVMELQKQAKKKPAVTVVNKNATSKTVPAQIATQQESANVPNEIYITKPTPVVPDTIAVAREAETPVVTTAKSIDTVASTPVDVAVENKQQPIPTEPQAGIDSPQKEETVAVKENTEPVADAIATDSKPVAVGPNVGIPEKKPEPVKPVVVVPEKKVEQPKQPEEKKHEEPKDELALLKEKFDRVVYARENAKTETPAAEPVQPEAVKPEETKAALTPPADDHSQTLAASADPVKYHIVKKGETAFMIAKEYHITMRQLMNWNGLDFDAIKIGQKLRVKP